jgi:hypothetical protein
MTYRAWAANLPYSIPGLNVQGLIIKEEGTNLGLPVTNWGVKIRSIRQPMEAISRMPNWEKEKEAILAIADFCLGEFNLYWDLMCCLCG